MQEIIHYFKDDGKTRQMRIGHIMAGDDSWDVLIDNYFQGTLHYHDGKWGIYQGSFLSDEIDFMVQLLIETDADFIKKCINRLDIRDANIREHNEFLKEYRRSKL